MSLKKMKALVRNGSRLAVAAVDRPRLRSDEEVLLRVTLAGLCRTDLYVADGMIHAADGLILGHEFAGEIVAAGDGASHLNPGDRVCVNPVLPCADCPLCRGGRAPDCPNSTFIGIDRHGCFAGYAAVPASAVHRLPAHMPDLAAAYCEPAAASLAVLKSGIDSGERGAIFGRNRFSQLMEKILVLKGFKNVLLIPDLEAAAAISACSFDFIIETALSDNMLGEMARLVKPGGRIILKSRVVEPVQIRMCDLIKKEPQLHVVNYGSFQEALELLSSGLLKIDDLVDGIYPLDEHEAVFRRARENESLKPFFDPWS